MKKIEIEREFFRAIAQFLDCRIRGLAENYPDPVGAFLGEMDWVTEASLILKETR
jgi:hypothetical protein